MWAAFPDWALPLAIAFVGCFAGWLTCWDVNRRGIGKLRPCGWVLLTLICATTYVSVAVAEYNQNLAREEMRKLQAQNEELLAQMENQTAHLGQLESSAEQQAKWAMKLEEWRRRIRKSIELTFDVMIDDSEVPRPAAPPPDPRAKSHALCDPLLDKYVNHLKIAKTSLEQLFQQAGEDKLKSTAAAIEDCLRTIDRCKSLVEERKYAIEYSVGCDTAKSVRLMQKISRLVGHSRNRLYMALLQDGSSRRAVDVVPESVEKTPATSPTPAPSVKPRVPTDRRAANRSE